MNLSDITNQQLYEIIQNNKLDKEIREKAGEEFFSRKLENSEIAKISLSYQDKYKHINDPLELKFKILVIIFPFIPLYWFNPFALRFKSILAGQFLPKGYKRKWKEYWLFTLLGYLLWAITIILFYKYSR